MAPNKTAACFIGTKKVGPLLPAFIRADLYVPETFDLVASDNARVCRRHSPRGARLSPSLLPAALITAAPSAQPTLPSGPLVIRAFTLRFDPAGTFTLSGDGWPSMAGTWTTSGREVTLQLQNGAEDCTGAGRYTFDVEGARVSFNLIADDCQPRRMILDRSQWLPAGVQPPVEARRIVRSAGTAKSALPPRARYRPLAIFPRTRSGRQRRRTTPA